MITCFDCHNKLAKNKENPQKQLEILSGVTGEAANNARSRIQEKAKAFDLKKFMVTSSTIANHRITETLGMVNGECVIGSGAIASSFASFSDVFGTVTEKGTQKFIIARMEAEKAMLDKASKMGAEAIVDVQYNFLEYSDSIQGMLVSGTAVKIEKIS